MSVIISGLTAELRASIDPKRQNHIHETHSAESKWLGVRVPKVRQIAQKYFPQIKPMPFEDFLNLSEELLGLGYGEYKILTFDWVWRRRRELKSKHFRLLESWLMTYADDW